MPSAVPNIVGVYRIVHIDNLKDILVRGMFAATHPDRPDDYRFIGNKRLTLQRKTYRVSVPSGGELGDYVPFYFSKRSVMLYNIHTGYGGIEQTPQEQIIYVLCKLDSLEQGGCQYCFTDGHAKSNQTRFYTDRADLDKLDWDVLKARQWNNTLEDRDRMRRKQAELLVRYHVPVSCIDYLVVYNQATQRVVKQIVVDSSCNVPVATKPLFYY